MQVYLMVHSGLDMNSLLSSKIIYPIIVISLLVLGIIIGIFSDPYLPYSLSNTKKGYDNGFAAARAVVEGSSFGTFFKTETDVRVVTGTITAISGNQLSLHDDLVINPFEKNSFKERTIVMTDTTKVTKLIPKNKNTVATQVTASPSNIQVGDSVMVTAGENIKTLAEFAATDIQILSSAFTR